MGELAGKLLDNVLRLPPDDETPDVIDEIWMGFRFSIETAAEFVDRHDQEMRALVEARNDLVHHFLPQWHSSVDGNTDNALAYLDAQRDETMRMMDRLQGWARTVDVGKKQLAEFWSSAEFPRQFELAVLRGSRLIVMLGEIAKRAPRADGWVMLSTAGQLIKRDALAELQDLQKQFGYPNLKAVLLASELFDVTEEPTPSGVTRTIYRINERYELLIHREPLAAERSGTDAGSDRP